MNKNASYSELKQCEEDESFNRILIVDDDFYILTALEKIIANEGYIVLKAQHGQEAVSILKKNCVAIIICDQHMPGMSGLEVLKESLVLQPDAIRIVLTGVHDLKIVEQLINEGQIAQFILKPWDHTSLMQTIKSSQEKFKLVFQNKRLNTLIRQQHDELQKNHENLQQELRIGGMIQQILLFGKTPSVTEGIDIQAFSASSKEIDGDFFEFYQYSPALFDLVIGDVMGKGLPAALVGTALKMQLMRFALPFLPIQKYDRQMGWHHDTLFPEDILENVHRELYKPLMEIEYFATLFYGRFNLTQKSFCYIDCGAPKPLHFQNLKKNIQLLEGDNFPLGVSEKENYKSKTVSFDEGDVFIFYSDGVTGARSKEGSFYGLERLTKLVQANRTKTSQEIIDLLKQDISYFSAGDTYDDDITVIVIKITDVKKFHSNVLSKQAKLTSDLSQLKVVRDFVSQVCSQEGKDFSRIRFQLQLAINEVFCNIVKHGYQGDSKGEILISVESTKEGILFDIADKGKSFDPSLVQSPSFIGDQEDGFGLYMIREIADEVSYIRKKSEGGMNHLRIFKKYLSSEGSMDIAHQTKDDILTICPEGDNLDAKEAPEFKQHVIDLISQTHLNHVVIDLRHLNFIDSSGLGSFLSLLRVLNSQGGDLKISQMNKPIRAVFELVCMHKIFEIYNTTEEALRSFKPHK